MENELLEELITRNNTKIAMIILDGLGGLPEVKGGKTELESAKTPNMDALAEDSILGLSIPVRIGVTSGSGPGHLGLFGYDPVEYQIGRGAMEALGVDFDLNPNDVAARGNFCTVDDNGLITDRRAGRLPNCESEKLISLINEICIEDVTFEIRVVKEHRFALVMHGNGLGSNVTETDPLKTNALPLEARALDSDSEKTATLVNKFLAIVSEKLKDLSPANMITLRGFAQLPKIPSFQERYGLNAAAIAVNGMYKGVSRMVGMSVLPVNGETPADEFSTLEKFWGDHDFFYLHIKKTDTAGEDGDFWRKVRAIEEVDALIPRLTALNPDVIIIGGDHSSPAVLKFHSWHPVPLMIYGKHVRADCISEFGERACTRGSLGVIPAKEIMPLALANAGRFAKYGA